MEDRDKILDYTKPVKLPDDCSKNRKNFTQGYFYREIGRYENVVPSEFQWAAEDKLINKSSYEELKCQLPDSPRSTFLMVFSPDGKKVASTHGNHNVYVTDLTTGKNIQTLSGHPRTPWCIAFHPSSNQILASGCLGGQVRVWDLHGGSEVWTAESQTVIASLAFHPVDRMLVIATYNELHFWDWSQPEPFAKCSTKSGREKVRYVSFDRLGSKLITGIANPANIPSQWDRISMVNSQPPVTSTSTSTTNSNSTPATTVATTQASSDQRYLTSWYRNFMFRHNQFISMSRSTPTIDRGTDPMDLLELRSNGNNSENNTSNSSPSASTNSQTHPSLPSPFEMQSACRFYHSLISREQYRIHSSVFRRFNRLSNSLTSTTPSTSVSQSSVNSVPFSPSSPSTSPPPPTHRLRHCTFNLRPTARSWCLTLGPGNSSNLFSNRTAQSVSTSGAVTNPTYTSCTDRGIFSTRETASTNSDRSQFSVVRPFRMMFDDAEHSASRRSEQEGNSFNGVDPINSETSERRSSTVNSPDNLRSPSRDLGVTSPEGAEIERELQRSNSERRQESSLNNQPSRSSISSTRFQLTPEDLRNASPVRRFREDASSDGELSSNSRRESESLIRSLMHPRPLPRFQVRSRLLDQQSQLHLITNRETHGLNLQNSQTLRRQLSFRPGGQFVLSRHSNSPFQPRVPHHVSSPTQNNSPTVVKNNAHGIRPEIPSSFSNFSSNTTEVGTSTPCTSTTNSSSVASNLSFTGETTSRQLPEQINRRLFDRVKMLLRDRIRISSENAATDSTVNYSRITGESEPETRGLLESEDRNMTRGLGPRGADPMLSSASENFDTPNESLLFTDSEQSGTPASANGSSNVLHSELRDPWESETDTVPFSLSSPLSLHDILNEPSQTTQDNAEGSEQGVASSARDTEREDADSTSPEFSMRQGIQLLSLHIENMQRLCLARIEILQLQKIRRMWEDLTNQIRCFHNTIQNRATRENLSSSTPSQNTNSPGEIPSIRNLVISSSPNPESNSRSSNNSENTRDSNNINGYKELVESMVNELLIDSKKHRASNNGGSSRNDSEEPQPGPSGLSRPASFGSIRNSIWHLEFKVRRLLRDIIQKTRRRREGREGGANPSPLQRQNSFRIRSGSRTRFRNRHGRHMLDLPSTRCRALSRRLEALQQTWRNEKLANKSTQSTPTSTNNDLSQPSTSTPKPSADACQSCGQKKKPAKELFRPKRRSVDSLNCSGSSGSASKLLKNNVGERSEVPSQEPSSSAQTDTEPSTSSGNSFPSQSSENSTNELLKQMLQTMETMLKFQREAFRRTQELTGERTSREQQSSDDDSDVDQSNVNEQNDVFMRDLLRNFRSTREVIRNSMQDIVQIRAKRLLGFMVKSLNQFFGKNFTNLNHVLDEQIFSLYMLLDLALELTDLLLDQLNARSRDLERRWSVDGDGSTPQNRERNYLLTRAPSAAGRLRDRSRVFGRSFYTSPYSTNREGSSNPNGDRFSNSPLPSFNRRRRAIAVMSTSMGNLRHTRYGRRTPHSNGSSADVGRTTNGSPINNHYRRFRFDRRSGGDGEPRVGIRAFNYEINNNSRSNDTNNNYNINDDRNNNNNNDNRNSVGSGNSSDINNDNINSNFLNYYFPSNNNSSSGESSNGNIIIVTSLNSSSDLVNGNTSRNGNDGNNSRQSQNPLPPLRSVELTLSRNESGDLSLRDERPIFWIRCGGSGEPSGSSNSNDSSSRVSSFTVPVVQVNDVPVSDVSMLNQPRHRPQSPVPRVPEDIWRWRAWRPRFLHPRYGGPNPFDDQDSNDVPENIHYYRILSTSAGSHLGVYTLDPMIITDPPIAAHHRIQAWDFSKMNIPDISDREANGVVPECKIHNDASVDVSNDGHLLVTLLPSGRLSVTTMLGVYSLDWSSLGQLLYRTSFEQSAVSVSLSPTNRHLLVGLASRPVVVRDRTNMAQIFRLEGGRPSPHGGSWQSGRGRLVHMRDLEQTRETSIVSLNCIRWAPGAGQGLVYGTNTGQLKVLR